MSEQMLARLDNLSRTLLWLWALVVLGALLVGRLEPLRQILDYAAWGVFAAAFLASFLGRWLNEIVDADPIGPLRIWMAAGMAALLMCLASTFVVAPKVEDNQVRLAAALGEGRDPASAQASLRKARSVLNQMLGLRVILALGLGYGVILLPKKKVEKAPVV